MQKVAKTPTKLTDFTFFERLEIAFLIVKSLLSIFISWLYFLIFPRPKEDISRQLALVTGGANGIGREMCLRLAKEGCNIAVLDINYESAKETAEKVRKFGVACQAFKCDVADHENIADVKERIEKEMGQVDILVNNAGLLYTANFLKNDIQDIKRTINVNLLGYLLMTRAFLPSMVERKRGKVIAIASLTSLKPAPASVVYSASKFGVNGFMEALQMELSMTDKDEFIKLTTVYPNFVQTNQELMERLEKTKTRTLLLQPQRVADETVSGMLAGKRRILISYGKLDLYLMSILPNKTVNVVSKKIADMDLALE